MIDGDVDTDGIRARTAGGGGHRTTQNKQQTENVTDIIKTVLEGYDIRLRPDFGGKISYLISHH